MVRKLFLYAALFGGALLQFSPTPVNAETFVVYEYGFEDDWNDWQHADPWEISRDDSYSGDFSVHCPVEANLNALLTSPTVELPDDEWQLHFEFRVRCDAKAFNPNNDNLLDDYFRIELMSGGGWQDVVYDYGRNQEWQENWILYGPGVWFRDDMPEWRVMLDLSQFAGQEIALRWRFITDDNMQGDQGSGIWIDDVRIIASDNCRNDVGVEWVHIDYPTTLGHRLTGLMRVTNFGLLSQIRVLKFIQIDRDRRIPITPWEGLAHLSSEVYEIDIAANRLTHSGTTHTDFITEIEEDENPLNDTIPADIFIYPPNVWQLGYNDRHGVEPMFFDWGGPAVRFTPSADGVPGDFNLSALEFLWSDEQMQDAVAELKISRDSHNEPGEVLYRANIVVTPEDVYPRKYRLDLTDIEELHDLNFDFWVSVVPARDGGYPQVLGSIPEEELRYRGDGHYYNFDRARVHEVNVDYQIQAILSGEDTDEPNLVAQSLIDFGGVSRGRPRIQKLTVMGGGTSPVTIEEIRLNSDVFSISNQPALPLELAIGDTISFDLLCEPDDLGIFDAEIGFVCDDESPPSVRLTANAGIFPQISVEPSEIDLGMIEIGAQIEAVFTITNNGPVDLVVSEIVAWDRNIHIEMDQDEVIPPDSDFDFFIVFTPTRIGRIIDNLRIFSNDPYTPQYLVPVSGFVFEEGSPVVQNPIDDMRIAEDHEPFAVADLDEVFTDLEGDEMIFSATSNREGLFAEVDDDNVLWLTPQENWNGRATVTVLADDQDDDAPRDDNRALRQVDGDYTIEGFRQEFISGTNPIRDHVMECSFVVTVAPVNDPPGQFDLISPPDGFIASGEPNVVDFVWESSPDVDGEAIRYSLCFDFTFDCLDTAIYFYDIQDTTAQINLSEMLRSAGIFRSERDTSLTAEWRAVAYDQVERIGSTSQRSIEIGLPLSAGEPGVAPLPNSFSIFAYPNPFNSSTTIHYSLPKSGRYSLDVVDIQGRLVTRLSDGRKEAGSHREVWDVRNWTSGQYVIRLNSNKESYSRQVTIIK